MFANVPQEVLSKVDGEQVIQTEPGRVEVEEYILVLRSRLTINRKFRGQLGRAENFTNLVRVVVNNIVLDGRWVILIDNLVPIVDNVQNLGLRVHLHEGFAHLRFVDEQLSNWLAFDS